jgi:formylglycine-generating enzyme required for sulfatase activity
MPDQKTERIARGAQPRKYSGFTIAGAFSALALCSIARAETGQAPIAMVQIPGGEFRMGSGDGQAAHTIMRLLASVIDPQANEKPSHLVTLSPFALSKTEITLGQYIAITNVNPCTFEGGPNLPVEGVTWYDAALFCNALSRKEGLDTVYAYSAKSMSKDGFCVGLSNLVIRYSKKGYRLPTEAEWEYACRAKSTADYFWGADSAACGLYGWHSGNAAEKTHVVGGMRANALGLHDMCGNVLEWCNDVYGPYSDHPQTDPQGPPGDSARVVRGGSYAYPPVCFRAAFRQGADNAGRHSNLGFRIALGTPAPQPALAPKSYMLTHRITMVSIPKGTVCRGSKNGPVDERPEIFVEIPAFQMSRTEITNAQYGDVMGANPSFFKGYDYPVENVTWFDAVLFCNALSNKEKKDTAYSYAGITGTRGAGCTGLRQLQFREGKQGYRLPTEAEWEYACRGFSTAESWWESTSDTITKTPSLLYQCAVYKDNSRNAPRIAGSTIQNDYKLADMSGNVAEWCYDWYAYYTSKGWLDAFGTIVPARTIDPIGPPIAKVGAMRVIRGGSFEDGLSALRCSARASDSQEHACRTVGFRIALDSPDVDGTTSATDE